MSKFKKINSRILCGLSAFVFIFSALFYPLENFMANVSSSAMTSTTKNISFNIDITEVGYTDSNVLVLPNSSTFVDLPYYSDVQNFYYYYSAPAKIFETSKDVYAYKVKFECTSFTSFSQTNCFESRLSFGTVSEFSKNNVVHLDNYVKKGYSRSAWYTSDFTDGLSVYAGWMFGFYDTNYATDTGGGNSTPTASIVATYTVTITPYGIDDLTDEIYSVLQDIYSQDAEMLEVLRDIYDSQDTLEARLQSLVNIANSINSNTDELEGLLLTCNTYLVSIKNELQVQTTWLENIYNMILDIFDSSDKQQDKVDSFNSESKEQSNSINNMVGTMDSVDRPQTNPDSIDQYIPSNDSFIMIALDNVMDFGPITDMLLCTMILVFVAYVLYGKR